MAEAPSSLGALPVGADPDDGLLLPVADDEAFWIGLDVAEPTVRIILAVAVVLTDGHELDVISGAAWNEDHPHTVIVPEVRWLEGIPRTDGRIGVLARAPTSENSPPCQGIRFWAKIEPAKSGIENASAPQQHYQRHEGVLLSLVDYETFRTRTGLAPPTPLDPDAGYKGWLLP